MEKQQLQQLLATLAEQLQPLEGKQYDHFEIAEHFLYNKETSRDDRFIASQIMAATDPLGEAINRIVRLTKPVKVEGTLRKNKLKRYEVDGNELTTGSTVEVLLFDDEDHETGRWALSKVLHNGDDYYLTAAKELPMQGQTVRLR